MNQLNEWVVAVNDVAVLSLLWPGNLEVVEAKHQPDFPALSAFGGDMKLPAGQALDKRHSRPSA
jgi:hypothetical protein